MEPGQLIFSLLRQSPAVAALAGARIFPLRVSQGQPRPALVYQVVGDSTDTLPACAGNESPRVQVSIFADTYSELCALGRAVKNALHGYRDGQLTVDYENGIDQPYEADAACFHRVQDYALDYPADASAMPTAATLTLLNAVAAATAAEDPDADTVMMLASTLVVGGRLVARLGGLLLPYDAANRAHLGALVGVALTTGNAGQQVRVRQDGPATLIGWGLTPDADYFAGPNGTLVRDPAGLAFSHLIGRAVSADRLLYAPQDIFIL